MTKSIFIGRKIEKETEAWLRNYQVDYFEQALIDIQFSLPDFSFFREIDAKILWVVTSKWAAEWLLIYSDKIGFKKEATIFCISSKQAKVLKPLSGNIFISNENNSNSVSSLVVQENKGEAIVYLKGNKSLNILEANLSQLQSGYFEMEVYKNIPLNPIVRNKFDAYLFFSPSGIESFIKGENSISENSTIISIGRTTAKMANEIFNQPIYISPGQNELLMVQFACSILKRQELSKVRNLKTNKTIA